jgi:hypothetical protein
MLVACGDVQSETQRISVSMAECGAIFQTFSLTAEAKGKTTLQITTMRRGVAAFREAAIEQARKEGAPNPAQFVEDVYEKKSAEWRRKAIEANDAEAIAGAREMFDWVQYCGKMGKAYDVLPVR